MDPVEPRERLSASEARARLPELYDQVTGNPGTTVCIAAPNDSGAVLVDAVHYEVLLLKAGLADRIGLTENRGQAPGQQVPRRPRMETNPPFRT
jgi:PHD/YefM family antitoxin component YafN of YafNO toxin-antitoxin module